MFNNFLNSIIYFKKKKRKLYADLPSLVKLLFSPSFSFSFPEIIKKNSNIINSFILK